MSTQQETIDQFDRMHTALSKVQGMMSFMMYYKSRDNIPDSDIRNMAWLVHDLCSNALEDQQQEQKST